MLRGMATAPRNESRRYDFPPLWAVPLLLIPAIGLIFYAGAAALGVLGLIASLFLIAWLQRKADAYVRDRDTGE